MNHPNRAKASRLLRSLPALALAALLAGFACSENRATDINGETHFLKLCEEGSATCGSGLTCLCGVCTRVCAASSDCSEYPAAECLVPVAACTPEQPPNRCDVRCEEDADCRVLSNAHRCDAGFCRIGPSVCASGEVAGNQVVVLGDSFIGASHEVTAGVESAARAAGALPDGQRYRDESSIVDNGLALGDHGMLRQFERALAEAPIEVVIMNGGGADVLAGSCEEPPLPTCEVIAEAATAAEELFARMASAGVADVFYAFYPDPLDDGVRGKMDALRPLVEAACANSPVPCHFVDLRPVFAGRYDEYIESNGLNPTSAGSLAAANAIWATMQALCIAQ